MDDTTVRQLSAMALMASLRTAADVCRALALRHRGEDPSGQEALAPTRTRLREAHKELQDLVVQLRLNLVVDRSDAADLARAFEDRMLLTHAARELHLVHQRLLSLYPAVEPELVERARVVQAEAARLAAAGEDSFTEAAAVWADAARDFVTDLKIVAK